MSPSRIGLTLLAGVYFVFGPVVWFSLLMIILLVGSYAPARWLSRVLR